MSQHALQGAQAHGYSSHPSRRQYSSFASPTSFQDDGQSGGRLTKVSASSNTNSQSSSAPRSNRRPIPSPLSLSAAVSPSGPSPTSFPSPPSATFNRQTSPYSPTSPVDEPRSPREKLDDLLATEKTYYQSDSSGRTTPELLPSGSSRTSNNATNDGRSVSDPVPSLKPAPGLPKSPLPPMAGSKAASRVDATKGPLRNSSMDSAISAATHSHKDSRGSQPDTSDIADLIKTAGSAEAVIQYLLKEKHSQSQQNSQLWRLVDKQRAMILGLNKDLERSLKDKEKYRKKLKEVMSMPGMAQASESGRASAIAGRSIPKVDISGPTDRGVGAPDSPGLDSDSQKQSPIDMSMAPYPITPPADQPLAGPPSAVSEMLDPSHTMPRPQEHAYDKYDHEAEERAADVAKQQEADRQLRELPINMSLPPSRSLPTQPPRMPPPKPPISPPAVSVVEATPQPNEGLGQFPSPPPRKGPPAPLQLDKGKQSPPNDDESDSDYDDILQVEEILDQKRGRRRTREEDEHVRELLKRKESELSLSKKNSSSKGTPTEVHAPARSDSLAPSPGPVSAQHMIPPRGPSSLAGMLSRDTIDDSAMAPPLASPGLPISPRPFGPGSTMASPPSALSSRGPVSGSGTQQAVPLSPRPPRQAIPMPPGTSIASPPAYAGDDSMPPGTPKASPPPYAADDSMPPNSPTDDKRQRSDRARVYKGLVTEEHPDLLLPPNALPSIRIKVASSRMKPSRASVMSLTQMEEDPVFTLAIFSRASKAELWRIEKDSASLSRLDQKLKACAAFTAKAPDRSLFSGHAPAKLDARRQALDCYLEEVLETPFDMGTALELCKYLSTNTLPPDAGNVTPESIADTSSTRSGPGGRPFKNGYLTKRGKNFGGWKARFFVLDGPQLKYFEAPGGAHLGTIKLPYAQIGKQSQNSENQPPPSSGPETPASDNQYRHAFLILEPKKKDSSSHVKHVLCAENDLERDQWVEALLRWIDYREPGEDDSPSSQQVQERHNGGGAERTNPKKKKSKTASHHEPTNSDGLIGVSYDSTSQGDLPNQGAAATRPKTSSGLPEQAGQLDQPSMLISGPRDMQPIADVAAWGNKPGLSAPTQEEKKQRKRSFFGFGPKTRSSADGHDVGSGADGISSSTPPQGGYQGPVRQAFGAPLAEAVRYSAPVDVQVPLPAVVYRCIQYLDAKNAILEEGIFRLSGSNLVIKQLRERFNTEGDINLITDEAYYDIHAVASLLKLYLRELPTTILTRDLHLEFLGVTEMNNPKEKVLALSGLVQRLPLANATLLKYLIAFLIKIINNADINKMTVRNVGIVFSPTLNIPAPVFAMFLQYYEPIFGIDPEEYELPSPSASDVSHDGASTSTGRSSVAGGHARPHEVPRPGTSGHSQSPHRQRLLEAVQQGQPRSGGTPPPLLQDLNAARASPTQSYSTNRATTYEPYYMTPQQQQQQAPSRAAYEGSLGAPHGYEASGGHGAPPPLSSRSVNPGYDRPLYPSSSTGQMDDHSGATMQPPEQSYRVNKRRESAMFNGGMIAGLNHQGSRSRLRDETRF